MVQRKKIVKMGTTVEFIDIDSYCRICFERNSPVENMIEIKSFLPLIKMIAQTKLLNNESCPSKVCSRCANGLILASMFRMKVIESNVLCREFLQSINLEGKEESIVLKEEVKPNIEIQEAEVVKPLQIENSMRRTSTRQAIRKQEVEKKPKLIDSDDDYEMLEALEDVDVEFQMKSDTINIVPLSNLQSNKVEIKTKEVTPRPEHKNTSQIDKIPQFKTQFDNEWKKNCRICMKFAEDSLSSPKSRTHSDSFRKHIETINNIFPNGQISFNGNELLCTNCIKKLDDVKNLIKFCHNALSRTRNLKSQLCYFCEKEKKLVNISPHMLCSVNSTQKSIKKNVPAGTKVCKQCLNYVMELHLLKKLYEKTEMVIEQEQEMKKKSLPTQKLMSSATPIKVKQEKNLSKSENTIVTPNKPKRKKIVPKSEKMIVAPKPKGRIGKKYVPKYIEQEKKILKILEDELKKLPDEEKKRFMADTSIQSPKKRAPRKKIIRSRNNPKYVEPPPDEPISEDYQCHFSDFLESDSDYELPPVSWKDNLNIGMELPRVKCPQCDASFVSTYEIEVHIEVMHNTFGQSCNLCDRDFGRKNCSNIRSHKLAVHFRDCSTNYYKKEMCEICGLQTKDLDVHQSSHSDERPFICHTCGYGSKTKYLLQMHIRTHTGDKRYKCEICDKRFVYGPDHKRHMMKHTGIYAYNCLICGKGFVKKNFLRQHQKTHDNQYATLDAI